MVDSTEVVEAHFFLTAFYGATHQPAFENESEPLIKDSYILAEFCNVTKKPMVLLMENHWVRPRPENFPAGKYYDTVDNSILTTETVTDEVKPGQTVTIKIKIPEGLGKVKYEGWPGERDV